MRKCDCCHTPVTFTREFRLSQKDETNRPEPGPWLVCGDCATLINARDQEGLFARIWPAARRNHLFQDLPDWKLRAMYTKLLASYCAYWDWLATPALPVTIGRIPGLRQFILGSQQETIRRTGEESFVPTAEAFARCSYVLWRPDLWEASSRGREQFVGLPLTELQASCGAQIWLFEDGAPDLNDDRLRRFHDLPHDAKFLALYLIPVKFNGEPAYLNGLLYRRPLGSSPDGSDTLEMVACEPHFSSQSVLPQFAPFASGLAFMDLEWVGRERHRHPEHLVKSFAKKKAELPEVYVIRLRRSHTDPSPAKSPGHEWDCSWHVSGYWRRQLCRDGFRPVYVKGHLKGNLSAPLRAPRDTIYHVNR